MPPASLPIGGDGAMALSPPRSRLLWTTGTIFALFASVIISKAWLADDSFVTLRQVINLLDGYGITWNPGVRVQGFTHPLWFMLLSAVHFVTREHFFTTIFLSIALSLGAIAILMRWCYRRAATQSPRTAMFIMAVPLTMLLFSAAFTDYATSGLENCLSYLLFSLLLYRLLDEQPADTRLYALSVIAACIVLNRFDHALLLLPAVLYAVVLHRGKMIFPLLLGGGIILLWLAFAVFYFGFPLPNTFYAKMNTGYPPGEYLTRGLNYFTVQLALEPATLLIIITGACAGLRRPGFPRCLAAGIVLYLLYTLWIGGDFMQGRYFAVPALIAVFLLAAHLAANPPQRKIYGVVALAVLFTANAGAELYDNEIEELPFLSDDNYFPLGVANERKHYRSRYGLLSSKRRFPVLAGGRESTAPVEVEKYAANQGGKLSESRAIHFVDQHALTDPLLAHLPAIEAHGRWIIGHAFRRIPAGYFASIKDGDNQVRDSRVRELYADILVATRGDWFATGRLAAIVRLNTRDYGVTGDYE